MVWLRTEATASTASSATAPTPTNRNAANSRHPSGPNPCLTQGQAEAEEDEQARQADPVREPDRHNRREHHGGAGEQDEAEITGRHGRLRISRPRARRWWPPVCPIGDRPVRPGGLAILAAHPRPGEDHLVPDRRRVGFLARYPSAGPLLARRLNGELIAATWDDLLRVAASVKGGHATAALVVGKLCSAKRQQNALTAAIKEYGALRRTVY